LVILGIQLGAVFRLAATLCENGGIINVMVKLEDTFVLHVVPHLVYEANRLKVTKVRLESWHAIVAKLHDLLTWPAIDRIANVIIGVMVVHDEEG